jgi:predicted TPR repeat methyltransferase
LEGEKNYPQAAQAYAQAIAVAGPNLGQIYKLDQARVLAAAGDTKAAAKLYQEILTQPAGQAVHERARGALAAMGMEVPAES